MASSGLAASAEGNPIANILIVEDDVFVREIAGLILEDLGHVTAQAGDMSEALGFLNSTQPFDAMFSDIRLKTMSSGGYDLADRAVGLRPTLRVLYTTGNTLTDDMRARFVEGARYLQKPYSEKQLQDSVTQLLAD